MGRTLARVAVPVLYGVFAAASLVLLARTLGGPFRLGLPVHSPLNAEGIAAVSFLLALLLRSRRLQEVVPDPVPASAWPWVLAGAALLIVSAFLPTLTAPLLHDSYIHVEYARRLSFAEQWHAAWVRPLPEYLFFRPLGFLSYWLDSRWAGVTPGLWHAWNIAAHVVVSGLVWLLARRLAMPRFPALITALVFALHGSRPEVVAWAAARFDLLATLFVLLTLLAVHRYATDGAKVWLAAALASALLALLSKEAAYCLPLLTLLLIPFDARTDRKRVALAAGLLLVLCGGLFGWRSVYLSGLGGYTTAAGGSSLLQFSAVRSAKALFYRQWAILFFPINWAQSPGPTLQIATVTGIVAAAGFLRFSQASRRLLGASLGFVLLAALPAQHLLLIGMDLNGSRILYLPAVGMALFWGFAVDSCRWRAARYLLPAGLLAFHLTALEHNLAIWREVAELSQRTCQDLGRKLAADPRPVAVPDLPATHDGIFFLNNGFPQCVEINSGQSASRVHRDDVPAGARLMRWSDETQSLVEVRE